ncbi:max-binding protein MNT [Megalops cyprinoides]|uniref:max-binding protein MNT n=1 Tax=Megalops cyprinoides TaxID=118141 RepID=UPI001863FDB2|nr:max-binding protein MNT [Megalops cyprinoides]
MSIETLLEAAKFLEWQALQQQKTREEDELKEKLCLSQQVEQKRAEVTSYAQTVRINHVTWGEKSCPEPRPTAVLPPALPSAVPITVIPIPLVSASPKARPPAPPTTLLPPIPPHLSPPSKDTHSPPSAPPQHQHLLLASQVKVEPTSPPQNVNPKQQQPYPSMAPAPAPATTLAPPAPQHGLLPQPMPLQAPPSLALRPGAIEDAKKRPGGTREVHNKLEKNRRAHLKECFETLKKNIPTVEEKKTSNLSVLRSALRYIQTLKRKEKEYEHEMERLAREKIATQQRLAELRKELSQCLDVLEIERVLRLTVQPEDDQASTSTASEGEDNAEEDAEEEGRQPLSSTPPKVPQLQPEPGKPAPVPAPAQPSPAPPPAIVPAPVAAPGGQPGVIAHAASHASVIQAVSHVIQAGSKHVAHIAPSPSAPVQLAPQPIGHITVHPVAHLGQPLPGLYPQPVAVSVSQPAVVSHIAHTLSHAQVGGPAPGPGAAVGAQVVAHPQLVGQTVLNPVTMVTMPSFPVSTLKLA